MFFDYDGTLTPIMSRPEEAVLSRQTRHLLRALARLPGCRVAVISGRELCQVRGLVGIEELAYAGNHGLEMAWRGRKWTHPGVTEAVPDMEIVKLAVTGRWPGVWVEDKGATLTIHHREAGPAVEAEIGGFLSGLIRAGGDRALVTGRPLFGVECTSDVPEGGVCLVRLAPAGGRRLELRRGKMSHEVRPRLGWDKGTAVRALARLLVSGADRGLLYAGDDATDEDAFRVLGPAGVGILVGERRDTSAGFRLADTDSLLALLSDLV
ncbi:MAG: trehalose-phosphatase [Pseudomonadota bacterium]